MKTRVRVLIACSLLAALAISRGAAAEESKESGGIEFWLIWERGMAGGGALRFDPARSERGMEDHSVFRLEIVNGTNREISVPAQYDGEVVRLLGTSIANRWPLHLIPWRGKAKEEIVRIAPGTRHTCAAFRLSDILSGAASSQSGWEWWWAAHPAPPVTPIHRGRQKNEGFVSTAVFWAEIVVDRQRLRTEPVIIEVQSEHKVPNTGQPQGVAAPHQPSG